MKPPPPNPTTLFGFFDEEPKPFDASTAIEPAELVILDAPDDIDALAELASAPVDLPVFAEPEPEPAEPVVSIDEPAAAIPAVLASGQGLLGGMFTEEDVSQILAARAFPRVDLDLETDYRCPCCSYEWSGNPKPQTAEIETALE